MNARQKAKKYKRMYEKLLNSPVQFKVEQHKIDTLRVERSYPGHVIMQDNSNDLQELIVSDIAHDLASNLVKYVNYRIEHLPEQNRYRFIGEIKVVDRL